MIQRISQLLVWKFVFEWVFGSYVRGLKLRSKNNLIACIVMNLLIYYRILQWSGIYALLLFWFFLEFLNFFYYYYLLLLLPKQPLCRSLLLAEWLKLFTLSLKDSLLLILSWFILLTRNRKARRMLLHYIHFWCLNSLIETNGHPSFILDLPFLPLIMNINLKFVAQIICILRYSCKWTNKIPIFQRRWSPLLRSLL